MLILIVCQWYFLWKLTTFLCSPLAWSKRARNPPCSCRIFFWLLQSPMFPHHIPDSCQSPKHPYTVRHALRLLMMKRGSVKWWHCWKSFEHLASSIGDTRVHKCAQLSCNYDVRKSIVVFGKWFPKVEARCILEGTFKGLLKIPPGDSRPSFQRKPESMTLSTWLQLWRKEQSEFARVKIAV